MPSRPLFVESTSCICLLCIPVRIGICHTFPKHLQYWNVKVIHMIMHSFDDQNIFKRPVCCWTYISVVSSGKCFGIWDSFFCLQSAIPSTHLQGFGQLHSKLDRQLSTGDSSESSSEKSYKVHLQYCRLLKISFLKEKERTASSTFLLETDIIYVGQWTAKASG